MGESWDETLIGRIDLILVRLSALYFYLISGRCILHFFHFGVSYHHRTKTQIYITDARHHHRSHAAEWAGGPL